MTYALTLFLWMATAQTADQPAPVPTAAVVQCPPSESERALRAQLDGARRKLREAQEQLAKVKDESGMPDHAVAALLVSEDRYLAPLERVIWRRASGTGRWRIRDAEVEVYVSRHLGETMTAVVLTMRNPREAPTWEPKAAFIRPPYYRREDLPVPVALRSSPERIRPGETARIALVFDRLDVDFSASYATLTLLRDGEFETEVELHPSDFEVASAPSGGDQ